MHVVTLNVSDHNLIGLPRSRTICGQDESMSNLLNALRSGRTHDPRLSFYDLCEIPFGR
jgi:hypothetical protein